MMFATPIYLMRSLFLLFLATAVSCSKFPLVETTSGTVRGYFPEPDVRAFLGIPYAQPPVKSLRFRSPVPIKQKAKGVIDATEFGLSCYQYRTAVPGAASLTPVTGESEDCLTLNVWISDKGPKTAKSVFVFMYGGAFAEGSSAVPMYDGRHLVSDHPDIIVVTLNYRVNIFGFANSPAVPEKNAGFRDQRLALEWLRDNIAAFGGDPKRMVLGGQSAGSMSTSIYAYAYPTDPIVQGLIMESGEATNPPPDDGTRWTALANALGCRSNNSAEELRCMQEIEAYTLKMTLSPQELNPLSSPAEIYPTLDNVTYFGPDAYATLGADGKFAKIPAIRGVMSNEGHSLTPFTPVGLVNETIADWVTEFSFNCPAAGGASIWAAHKVPSWRYRYFGEFPSLAIYDWMKAYHGADIPLLFGTINSVRLRDVEPYELEAQQYFQQAIVTFVKDPHNGLKHFGWPIYNPNTTSLVELFKNNSPTATFTEGSTYDTMCYQF